MQPLTLLGFGVFCAVSLIAGVRLLLLWRRTRELPELLISIGVLGIGPFGFAFTVIAMLCAESQPGAARMLWWIAFAAMNAGGAATYVFTWTVFRRDRSWAKWLTVAAAGAFAVLTVAETSSEPYVLAGRQSAVFQIASWLRIGCLGWGASESFRYWAQMRRRRRLGLADAVVTNRMLLWGLGIGAAALGSLVGTVAQRFVGPGPTPDWIHLSSSLHGLVAAVAMWLAFLPPRSYLRWVAAGAAPAAQPS